MDTRSASINSDAEKQHQHQHQYSPSTRASQPAAIAFLRVAQYISTTIALVFIACAIDRNILVPGVTTEEIVNCTFTVIAGLVIPFHLVTSYRKKTVLIVDFFVAILLFVAFVYGAVQAGQNQGACEGPSKMGLWDNKRGCTRMKISTAFAAVNFACFAASAAVAGFLS